jgi:hypothetical protein
VKIPKFIRNLNCGKSRPKIWATFVIMKKLPKVQKRSPNGGKFAQSRHPDPDKRSFEKLATRVARFFIGMYNIPKQ